jgi:hypothetical protein
VTWLWSPPAADVEAWEAYIAAVRHNRNLYLASVGQAKRDYQHDALPAEFAYDEAERHAWMTYYQADKQAWTDFQARLAGDRPPPARSPEHRVPSSEGPWHWPLGLDPQPCLADHDCTELGH